MTTKVTIDGINYNLDVSQAVKLNLLTPAHYFNKGDVFKDPTEDRNPLLLVQVKYEQDCWQLLGMGAGPNSNEFYLNTHTIKEIEDHLAENVMVFSHNINTKIIDLLK
jgi:hypothetical protein